MDLPSTVNFLTGMTGKESDFRCEANHFTCVRICTYSFFTSLIFFHHCTNVWECLSNSTNVPLRIPHKSTGAFWIMQHTRNVHHTAHTSAAPKFSCSAHLPILELNFEVVVCHNYNKNINEVKGFKRSTYAYTSNVWLLYNNIVLSRSCCAK